jgi:hypothetical protein
MSAPEASKYATPAEAEYAADPLGRELLRDDVIDQASKKLVEHLDKQVRPNLSQAEFREVIKRAKKDLDGEPIEETKF